MDIFLLIAMAVCIVGLIICCIQLARLSFLSNDLQKIIDEVYENRMAAIKSGKTWTEIQGTINYPDITATYNNLKWYKPWERTSTLIVYDKDY